MLRLVPQLLMWIFYRFCQSQLVDRMTSFQSSSNCNVSSHFPLTSSKQSIPNGSLRGISLPFASPSCLTRSMTMFTNFDGSPGCRRSSRARPSIFSLDASAYSGMFDWRVFKLVSESSFVRKRPGSIKSVLRPRWAVSWCRASTKPVLNMSTE